MVIKQVHETKYCYFDRISVHEVKISYSSLKYKSYKQNFANNDAKYGEVISVTCQQSP